MIIRPGIQLTVETLRALIADRDEDELVFVDLGTNGTNIVELDQRIGGNDRRVVLKRLPD